MKPGTALLAPLAWALLLFGACSCENSPGLADEGSASTATSLVTVSAATVQIGGSIEVVLHARDADGDALTSGGLTVAFTQGGGSSQGSFGPTVDAGDGTYHAAFTGTEAGTPSAIGATIDGTAVTTTPPTVRVLDVPPSSLTLTRSGSMFLLGGTPITRFGIRVANALQSDEIVQRLIDAFPEIRAHGIQSFAFTIQGGRHTEGGNSAFNGFNADGTLKAEFQARMTVLLEAAADAEMVPVVVLFYRGRDQELSGEDAVRTAVSGTVQFLTPWRNLWINAINEPGHVEYDHALLTTPAGHIELYDAAKAIDPQRIVYVSHASGANDGFLSDTWGRNGVGASSGAGTVSIEYLRNDTYTAPGSFSGADVTQTISDIQTSSDRSMYFFWHASWHQKADAPGWPRFDEGGAGSGTDPGVSFAWDEIRTLSGL